MPYQYQIYGLTVLSEIECPHMPEQSGQPDAYVKFKEFSPIQDPHPKSESFFLDIKGVAQFRIQNGSEIAIHPYPEAQPDDICLYLLGTGFAALIQQRGELALHACAVAKDGQAILIAGDSGAGKSTTAHTLVSRLGWNLCADDVSRFTQINGELHVHPAYPYIKIWNDVMEGNGISSHETTPINRQKGKHRLPIQTQFQNTPIPIQHIFFLKSAEGQDCVSHSITGSDKFLQLRKLIYRPQYLNQTTTEDNVFEQLHQLSQSIPTTSIERPSEFSVGSALSLAEHIETQLSL